MDKVDNPYDNVKSIRYQNLLIKASDGLKIDINVDTDQIYLDNNLITKIAQPLNNNMKMEQL